MTPERYRQIGDLFHAALEVDSDERAAFLERACADDPALRREVESLLASHQQASGFIASPALAVAAGLLAESETDALLGRTIARYRVLSLIGAGGMGRVYLAEDTELGRRVALKLLPEFFTHDKTQVQRFRQEARAASALNHPNIVTVHEVGQVDGTEFIVTEYVEGETLRDRLTHAPLRLREALDVTAQVADALAAAHEVGVVHRDIKPENIMLRRDGYVKVLDFGLAKLTENLAEFQAGEFEAPTREIIRTNPGMVLGTAEYMSPEQARSLQVDTRTDVWSLGVVLYEMVAGRRPFSGETYGDIIVSILEREPAPLARLAPAAPAELERIVTKALAKDREERYQTVKDMSIDLRRLRRRLEVEAEIERSAASEANGEAVTSGGQVVVASAREQGVPQTEQVGTAARTSSLEFAVTEIKRHKTGVALTAVLLIAALAGLSFGLYKFFARAQPGRPAAPLKVTPLTSLPGIERNVAFSPDGKQIAFVWTNKRPNFDVYVKLIGAGEPLRLTTDPGRDMSPAWSPDGRYIAFMRGTGERKGFYIVPSLGGAERKLTDAYGWQQRGVMNQDVAWSPDGRTLAIVDKAAEEDPWCIYLLSVETGERRKLTTPPAKTDGDTTVAFSPDGQTLAFVRSHNLVGDIYLAPGDIYLAPVTGGDPVRLTFDEVTIEGLAWTPDGSELVFSSDRGNTSRPTLWRVPVKGGTPEHLGLGDGIFDLSISAQGGRMAFAQESDDFDIHRVEVIAQPGGRRKIGSPTNLISSTRSDSDPYFSPDGQRIVFMSNRSGKSNLWVCDAEGKNLMELTDGLYLDTPRWSPDGRLIVFSSLESGNADISVIDANGGAVRRLTHDPSAETTPIWSPDGSWLYFGSNRTGRAEVWKMPAAGGSAVQLTHGGGFNPIPSLDGHTVYYLRDEKEPWLWAVSAEGGVETGVLENPEPGKWLEPANWAVVQHGIYFLEGKRGNPYTLKFFDFETRRTTLLTTFEPLTPFAMIGLTVAPDERSILYSRLEKFDFDLMLVENFH